MIAEPNAMSHAGVAATIGAGVALTGISAANVGAAETASAATTNNMTFFIDPAPSARSDNQPMLFRSLGRRVLTGINHTPQLASADKIPLCLAIGQAKESSNCCLFG